MRTYFMKTDQETEFFSDPFTSEFRYHTKTIQLICTPNQFTCFYVMETPLNFHIFFTSRKYENEKKDCTRTFLFNSCYEKMLPNHTLEW